MTSRVNRDATEEDDGEQEALIVNPTWVYLQVAAFMAVKHFNARNGELVPKIGSDLNSCNVQLAIEFLDSQYNPLVASKKMMKALDGETNHRPAAFFGEIRSVVSQVLATLSGVQQVPLISAASTSKDLDNTYSYPYFGRTIPTNEGDAKAIVRYLAKELGVKHLGLIYVRDSYGAAFASAVNREANKQGIPLAIASYEAVYNEASMMDAVQTITRSGVRYIFAILNTNTWQFILSSAVGAGIAGNEEYAWFLSEGFSVYSQEADAYNDPAANQALQYAGYVELYVSPPTNFMKNAFDDFINDLTLQEEFLSINDNSDALRAQLNYTSSPPQFSVYYAAGYDAMMALGLAACSIDDPMDGPALFQQFIDNPPFQGVSGQVVIDPLTGTRALQGVRYALRNLIVNHEEQTFNHQLSAIIELHGDKSEVTTVNPFRYWGGLTIPPPSLPILQVEMNLIPTYVLCLGYLLCGLVLILSILCAAFTYKYRKNPVVRRSQPVFLWMMCGGTFLMGSTIVPLSFQEPIAKEHLNRACAAQLWTISFGFTTVFSALYCKMRRLNKVMGEAKQFRKATVRPADVLFTFMVLMSLNLVVLVVWMFVDPFKWDRRGLDHSVDEFGRATRTVGICASSDPLNETLFLGAFVTVNVFALVLANIECYKARNHPSRYQESRYLAMSMISLLEESILGLPLMYLLARDPQGKFLLSSCMVALLCVSVLLPTFLPKYRRRHVTSKDSSVRRRVTLLQNATSTPAQRQVNGSRASTAGSIRTGGLNRSFVIQPLWSNSFSCQATNKNEKN